MFQLTTFTLFCVVGILLGSNADATSTSARTYTSENCVVKYQICRTKTYQCGYNYDHYYKASKFCEKYICTDFKYKDVKNDKNYNFKDFEEKDVFIKKKYCHDDKNNTPDYTKSDVRKERL